MKMRFRSLVCASFLILVPFIRAQAVYSGSKGPLLAVGAGFLYLNNDYSPQSDQGVSAWVDANLNRWIGLEVEVHFGVLQSPSDYGENSYLMGPRLSVHHGNGSLYAKAMAGRADLIHDIPYRYSSSSYSLYALGAGVDYRAGRNWGVRVVDAEYQTWPSFKPHGLTPYAFSTGVMYIFH